MKHLSEIIHKTEIILVLKSKASCVLLIIGLPSFLLENRISSHLDFPSSLSYFLSQVLLIPRGQSTYYLWSGRY